MGYLATQNRLANMCLALLFAGGVVFVPAWHQAHCAGAAATTVESGHAPGFETAPLPAGATGHHADHCPICHLVNTPITAESGVVPAVPPGACFAPVPTTLATASPRVDHLLPFSCGPPA